MDVKESTLSSTNAINNHLHPSLQPTENKTLTICFSQLSHPDKIPRMYFEALHTSFLYIHNQLTAKHVSSAFAYFLNSLYISSKLCNHPLTCAKLVFNLLPTTPLPLYIHTNYALDRKKKKMYRQIHTDIHTLLLKQACTRKS